MARLNAALFFAIVIAFVASCGAASSNMPAASPPSGIRTVSSNVLSKDYAGTAACATCHSDLVDSFLRSPMHNMTREPANAVVHGPFDGTVFHFHGDTARLESRDGARFITLDSKRFGSGVYKVTRVIGGNHREDYAGIRVSPPDPNHEELVLPVSYVLATADGVPATLRYKGYSVMVKERPGLHAGPVWTETCIFCHNTPAYVSTVLGALAGPSAKPYQGEVVDPLLPRDLRATWTVEDRSGLEAALGDELGKMGVKRARPSLVEAVDATRRSFKREDLVELGIGCEACHLGAAEHVADPRRLPSLEPRTSLFSVKLPHEGRSATINRTCARCHQVLFSGYEPTWEGGSRHGQPGGSEINSGEARDMLLGACTSKLACTDCHDPHAAEGTKRLRALAGAEQDALCTNCHEPYRAPQALRAHSHHDPAGDGARCLNCHMPKKNLALGGALTRYHRIGSPNDPQKVLFDRPLECALCHADKSVESLVSTMESWWKRPFEREVLRRLYGALDANVMLATAERGKPHEQAVSFYALGRDKNRDALPIIASQLTNPYPLVRGYAKRALERIDGAPVPIDLDAEDADIELAAKAWLVTRAPGSSR